MHIINLRKNVQRTDHGRRLSDRRNISHPFGSLKWIEHVQQNYVAYPRQERRQQNRRVAERRQETLSEHDLSLRKFSSNLLSREELKLLEELYFMDFDELSAHETDTLNQSLKSTT